MRKWNAGNICQKIGGFWPKQGVGISDTVSGLKCDKFVVNFFLTLHTLMAHTLRSLEIKQ